MKYTQKNIDWQKLAEENLKFSIKHHIDNVIETKWNDCHHEGYTYRICVAKGTSDDKIEELVRKTIFNLMVLDINYYKLSN